MVERNGCGYLFYLILPQLSNRPPKYVLKVTHVATPSWAPGNQPPSLWTPSFLPPHLQMGREIHGSK